MMIVSALVAVQVAEQARRSRSPVSASRLPVGSSASRTRGWLTERPGDGGPLHLAAGQLARLVLQAVAQADALEQRGRPLRSVAALAPASPDRVADHRRHQHVLERRELRQQVVELEDEAEGAVAQPVALLRPAGCRCAGRRGGWCRRRAGRACRAGAAACSCRSRTRRRREELAALRRRGRRRAAPAPRRRCWR